MKKYNVILLWSGLFLYVPVQAQIKEYRVQTPDALDTTYCIPHYDSTSNITFHLDKRDYFQYIGQQLYFYERASKQMQIDTHENYYSFKLLQPDTVWYRKKKKPVEYKDYVVYDAYQHHLTTKHVNATPCQEIEGKTFTITAFNSKSDTLVFTLHSPEEDIFFNWEIKSPKYIKTIRYSFPAIVMGYYQKIKQQYVNRSFVVTAQNHGMKRVIKDISSRTPVELRKASTHVGLFGEPIIFKCVDVAIADIDNEYKIPYLIFEDSLKHHIAIRFVENPPLTCMLNKRDMESDSGPMGGSWTIDDFEDVIKVEQRALIKEQQRIAEQKKIEEQQIQERKLRQEKEAQHLAECIKKFGKHSGTLIAEGKVQLGMTKEQCEWAWGYPDDVNRTTGSFGTHEQWVYGGGYYLYFENGRLTVIQN